MKYLVLLAGCFIFLTACSTQAIAQQATDAPIKVTALTLNTDKSRTALRRADNWLTQPVVQVENISAKAIEYLVIEMRLPGADTGPIMLGYGQTPGHKSFLSVTEPLQPGKKISLS